MKFFFVIAILICAVSANQCLIQDNNFQSYEYKPIDCKQLLPLAVDKWKLFILVWCTCVTLNINIFRAFFAICIIVMVNHDVVTSMVKSQGMCV